MSNKMAQSDSIISKEWEYLDPTPDIHGLFLQFNQRFFGGRLEGVEVKWSPRMTMCAGVCSYEGRGGLCSVRLSAPLLKLRPRKDLVETLLHEMIHAFLFVTANNRDRDGHGPEFQKHMHRINNECGCKISIYHSFHEEVRLYQQHVWRCDGVCRSRKPFYGLVRRAMNRAPGPNDNWWAQHQASCGGKFTKIQEPESYTLKKNKASAAKENKNGDIRKFVFPGKGNVIGGKTDAGGANKKVAPKLGNATGEPGPVRAPTSSGNSFNTVVGAVENVRGFGATTSGMPTNSVNVPGNVRGFGGTNTGLGRPKTTQGSGNNIGRGGGGTRGAVSGRGGKTLVVTGAKGKTKEETNSTSTESQAAFVPFHGKGFVLGKNSATETNKNVKYPTNKITVPINNEGAGHILGTKSYGEPSTSKSSSSSFVNQNNKNIINNDNIPSKKLKGNNKEPPIKVESPITKWFSPTKKNKGNATISSSKDEDVILVDEPQAKCPVCNRSLPVQFMNSHLDECLSRLAMEEFSPAIVIEDDDDEEDEKEDNLVKCPLCDAYYSAETIETHVNVCVQTLHDAFEAEEIGAEQTHMDNTQKSAASSQASDGAVKCPVCRANVGAEDINMHLDVCLSESVIRDEQAKSGTQ